MKWIEAQQLQAWANRLDARQILPELVGQLVRASARDISAFRFPAGNAAQIHGWDGLLTASPEGQYRTYIPEGDSVWEFGVTKIPKSKAEDDFHKRTGAPGSGVVPKDTTFVFVTPRIWEDADNWLASKKELAIWRDVRVVDAVDLEEWMMLCPAVAAAFSRENNFSPATGALSVDEFWELYSRRFEPPLAEAVLMAGRSAQGQELQSALATGKGIQRIKGDSLEEVIGFLCATVRSADIDARTFLKARILIVQTEDAARQLRTNPNLSFAVRGGAKDSSGMLSDDHRVIVPVGRDDIRSSVAISLVRPTAHEMSEALQTMGFQPDKALTLAHECGKSVTVLARRIASGDPSACDWRGDLFLLPALLAGAWDHSSEADRAVITSLTGATRYEDAEAKFRTYLKHPDGPLEMIDSVWAVRAPVDMFVQLSHLLGEDDWKRLREAINTVLAELNPALDLPPGERMYAGLRNQTLTHSTWLRDGLCTTLLILAALGEQNDVRVRGKSTQAFVNELVSGLPGLREDYRLMASLTQQLPMLIEAAPDPLLSALEHLLEGGGQKLKSIFQDAEDTYSPWSSSPHTGILWALELIGRDPLYLQRAASILVGLEAIDPGGTLSNRPIGSLRHLFSTWRPGTNASHEMRLAVLAQLISLNALVAWKLMLALLPDRSQFQTESARPRFREAGASARETLTYPILYRTITWITEKAILLAASDPQRWVALLEKLNQLPPGDRKLIIGELGGAIDRMIDEQRIVIWEFLSRLIRRNRAHISAEWALKESELSRLETLEKSIAPDDTALKDRYLFTERLPDVRVEDAGRVWERIEEMRNAVIRNLLVEGGMQSVVQFASEVESPRYVGASLGVSADNPEELLNALILCQALALKLPGFISAVSSAGLARFQTTWSSMVKTALLHCEIGTERVAEIVEWWPHARETWTWVQQFGPEAEESYWKIRSAWGLKAVGEDLRYAVDHYLKFERPEYIVDALAPEADRLSEQQWFTVLNAFNERVSSHNEIVKGHSTSYHVQQIFKSLQRRPGISIEQLAILEYRFLPLLREFSTDSDPDSALDRYLAENPTLFVDVLVNVFRPASERGEPRAAPTSDQATRAQNSFRVLESFGHVPGAVGVAIDSAILESWVGEVRRLASKADRLEIAEQYIGKALFHCSVDPDDGMWPHKVVREGFEHWQAPQIEKGLYIAKANSRGVTSRGPYDGGLQERELAVKFRADAQKLVAWPRTYAILSSLAESYERQAQIEDAEAAQLRLRE